MTSKRDLSGNLTCRSKGLLPLVYALFQPLATHFLPHGYKDRSKGQRLPLYHNCISDLTNCKSKIASSSISGKKVRIRTSTFIAILQMPRGPIIPRTDDATFSNKDASHSPLHAIAPLCSKRCKLHKILVPIWP